MKNHLLIAGGIALFVGFWVFAEVHNALVNQAEEFSKKLDAAVELAYTQGLEQAKKVGE